MINTHGLTHISLAVLDPERSLQFYEKVFGVNEHYREFSPGFPYVFVKDPDGYEIEIWFE